MDSTTLADALRVVIVMEVAFIAGMTIVVFSLYLEGNRHIRRVDPTARGVLTKHVMAISASYLLLCVFAVAEIEGYYGTPLTWRTPIGLPAATMGLYALWNMIQFQRSRLDRRDQTVHTDGTPRGGRTR